MTTAYHHHPKSETLAAYAAGVLDEAMSVVIETHRHLCAQCDRAIRDFEAVGGVSLERLEPVALSEGALDRFWARVGAAPANDTAGEERVGRTRPLSAYLKGGFDTILWKPVAQGMSQHVLEARGYRKGVLRLLKIDPGVRMPRHTHGEEELTLILRGAYEDEIGVFREGDLADLDGEATHSPCAIGDEPCICLIATNGPLAFKGLIGRVVQPFVGL